MRPFYEIVVRPLITEKSVLAREAMERYTFQVVTNASKPAIRTAIQDHFGVKVTKIWTTIVRGKIRRVGRHQAKRPNWKKAIVTLAKGQKLEIFDVK